MKPRGRVLWVGFGAGWIMVGVKVPADLARMASRTTVVESAAFPARASRALFTLPRTALRTARLRSRRFSFCRIRFFAEGVLAKVLLLFWGAA